jgi:type IV secretion system protein VirD4
MEWESGILLLFGVFWVVSRFDKARQRERVKQAYKFNPPSPGSARFAEATDLRKAGLFKREGIPIGNSGGRALHYPGVSHILTIAGARKGKGATLLCNALLSVKGSCVVIDPKAELASITGAYRRRLGNVLVVNPFGIEKDSLKGLKPARFNPMDILDPSLAAFHAGCDKLAAALVWDDGNSDKHWSTSARLLVSGVIAALARHGRADEKNLVALARVISGDVVGFCQAAVQATTDPFIIQKLSRFAAPNAKDSREIQDVIATAIAQLGFIGNHAIAESLKGSDFRFRDLRRKRGTTIYIVLPLYLLDVCDKYFRLIMEVFLAELLSEQERGKGRPVLAIVDEMAQLGPHMKSLENAMGMAAGAAGLQIWCVLQNLSQLKGMFPNTWETFIQNSISLWFGANDQRTRDYVSQLAGTREIVSPSRSVTIDHHSGEPHVSDSGSVHTQPLLPPHAVGQLAPDEMIAFVDGVSCGPVKAKRKFYFRCAELWGKYRPNPYFKK